MEEELNMKKIALILALVILALSLVACAGGANDGDKASEETEKELITKVRNDDGGYTLYDYDDEGRCIKATTYSKDDEITGWNETKYDDYGIWSSKIYYDAEGKVVREVKP